MALALKCTRCGNYYEDYSTNLTIFKTGEERPYNALMKIDKDLKGQYYGRETIDLCLVCKESFNKWLNEEASNE